MSYNNAHRNRENINYFNVKCVWHDSSVDFEYTSKDDSRFRPVPLLQHPAPILLIQERLQGHATPATPPCTENTMDDTWL